MEQQVVTNAVLVAALTAVHGALYLIPAPAPAPSPVGRTMRFVVAPAWAALLVLARARAGAAGGRWVTAAVVAAVAGTVFALSWSRPLLASGVVIDAGVVAVVSAFRPASINGCDAPEGSGRYGTAPSEGPFGPGRRSRRGDTM